MLDAHSQRHNLPQGRCGGAEDVPQPDSNE